MFKPIKEFIKKQENKNKEYSVFLEIEKQFKKTQNKQTTKNLQIHDYKKGVLIIKAKTPAWRNEGSLLKTQIKKNF